MNFDDLKKAFLKGGEKALKTLASQLKQVMPDEVYDTFMNILKSIQNKVNEANTQRKECSNWLGGVV